MTLPSASAKPSDAAATARLLRRKSPLLPKDFEQLDREAKKRAFTVTGEVSLDAIRDMRDALAKAKADGIPYREFVATVGAKLDAQWGVDSPQLKTVFVNNVQQAANQAIVARLNRQRGKFPYWTLVIIKDEVTSATCGYFITHPVVLPAGHPWFAKNAPMRHHRCRTTLRGLTAAEARKIGISKTPPDWPADEGWGGSAPMGEYKANMSHHIAMADGPARYTHIDFVPPKGAREEAERGLEWRREHGRGGTSVGVARARDIANGVRLSPSTVRRMKAFFDRHRNGAGKGSKPGEQGFPSPWRIAWALWGGDAGYAWARKLVAQLDAADRKAMTMKDKKITADLGQADVHADGPMKTVRTKPMAKLPLLKKLVKTKAKLRQGKTMTRRGLSFRFARGGTSIEVRHMSDRSIQCPSVDIDTTLLDDSGPVEAGPPKLVWNQLNKLGAFRGHPSGPFEITEQINAEIERNFRATHNQKIPIDFEHASEQDPTAGTIPTEGAPAQGWIHDLQNRGRAGLWGLVEWLEPLRSYIKQGKYKFFSPAIRFGAKDRVTGQPIGARMTSGAATNNPFLDGLMPLAASDRGAGTSVDTSTETIQMKLGEYEFDAADVMPKLRMGIFGTGTHQADMANAAECYDALCRLEAAYADCVDEAPGAEPMRVQAALKRLRESMNLGMGMTVPEMIGLVKQIVESMIGEHVERMHPDEKGPPSSREMGNRTMADQDTTIKLRDAESKLATLMSEKNALETKAASLELQLADRNGKVASLELEVKTLRDEAQKRSESDETTAIELAFATYKDTHKLTDAHKKQMLLTYRHDRATFDQLYPTVAPDQRHLQRTLSNRQNAGVQQAYGAHAQGSVQMSAHQGFGQQQPVNFAQAHYDLTQKLMSDEKLPLEKATVEARRRLTTAPGVST
jgi:hypothetical protein